MASDDESTSSGSGSDPSDYDNDVAAYSISEASDQDEPLDLSDEDTSGRSSTEPGAANPVVMSARAYQLEMLEESMKRNTIVAVCSAFTRSPPPWRD
jgi:hypothetical protein